MRPELELLLCCARSTVSSESASQIRSLVQQNIDWSYVIGSASRHGVIPLLYLNLRDVCADAVPKTMLNSIRDGFHANARSNLCLSAELLKILDLFESNGVLALAYKGPLLATSVYGNLALRPAGDLDILIDKKNLQRAKELLESNGYTIQLNSAKQRYYLKNRSHYHFEHEDLGVRVEIHWQIVPKYIYFELGMETLWQRHILVPFHGNQVRSFMNEDLLLILCVHGGAKHLWKRLGWICDVAELIRVHTSMDWDWTRRQADELGCHRILLLGLLLAHDFLGTNLPPQVLEEIKASRLVKSVSEQVQAHLFPQVKDPYENLKGCILYLKMREHLWDKIRYVPQMFEEVITPTEKEKALLPLPAYLSSFYYLLRPIRLFIKYANLYLARIERGAVNHPPKTLQTKAR